MNLKEYEQEKFGIADIIRSAQAVDTKDDSLQSECRDLLTRLAEDRFNILVVGRFSRGKSTLMNAHPWRRPPADGNCPADICNHHGSIWKPQASRTHLQRPKFAP